MKFDDFFSFKPKHYYERGYGNGFVKFWILTFLGLKFYFYDGYKIEFAWADDFKNYFQSHDMDLKIKNLKQGLDNISCEYINLFMRLSKVWGKYLTDNYWSKYDKKLITIYEKSKFKQPFPDIATFNSFTFLHKYGLGDLPEDVLKSVNGKDIIDAGGLNGDTALIFKDLFPNSKIYVYEPLSENIETIKEIAERVNNLGGGALVPLCKGLGDKCETADITFNHTEKCEITTLEQDYKGNSLGLIKSDTEGYESKIIDGAANLIKKYKPVLVIAIYHTPEDFFEMKDKIAKLNPDYKFMIRRSEFIIPTADFILIAY